jgi:hypothetical protein
LIGLFSARNRLCLTVARRDVFASQRVSLLMLLLHPELAGKWRGPARSGRRSCEKKLPSYNVTRTRKKVNVHGRSSVTV